jgi:hypothetical protein
VRAVVLVIAVVACAACDGSAPAPERAVVDPGRPCEVATAAEIADAIGVAAPAASPSEVESIGGTATLCNYGVGRPYNVVSLHVEDDVSRDEFVDRMARDPLNTDELAGAGELAYTHGGVAVSVWDDERVLSASVQRADDIDEARRALEGLGRLFASKL